MCECKAVWVLTEEHNAYDQYGEYFLAVFASIPHHSELTKYGVPQNRLRHVLNGGGRVKWENNWFHLRRHEIKVPQTADASHG